MGRALVSAPIQLLEEIGISYGLGALVFGTCGEVQRSKAVLSASGLMGFEI